MSSCGGIDVTDAGGVVTETAGLAGQRSISLVRGYALHQIAPPLTDDEVAQERFYCDGNWMSQGRLGNIGRYVEGSNRVCVDTAEGAHFCRRFRQDDRRDRLIAYPSTDTGEGDSVAVLYERRELETCGDEQ